MLIKCDKHTKKDLELWKSYEEMDLINSENIGKKEIKSIEIIQEFDPNYISISWGKDSVVLAHLGYRAGNYQYCYFRNNFENQYCLIVRDNFLSRFKIKYKEYFDITDGKDFHKIHAYKKPSGEFGKKYITGIRMEESGIRKIAIKRNGYISENRCSPIAYLKEKDIFAYLAKYNLPVHPNYAMLGSGRFKRNKIRVGPLGMASQYYNELWEREYYLNELRILKKNEYEG